MQFRIFIKFFTIYFVIFDFRQIFEYFNVFIESVCSRLILFRIVLNIFESNWPVFEPVWTRLNQFWPEQVLMKFLFRVFLVKKSILGVVVAIFSGFMIWKINYYVLPISFLMLFKRLRVFFWKIKHWNFSIRWDYEFRNES